MKMLLPFSQEKNNLENIKSKNKNIVKIRTYSNKSC